MYKPMAFFVVAFLSLGISMAKAAPVYECGGNAACQAKRERMSQDAYDRNIGRCLTAAGATREQWRAHAVPRAQADKVRACLEARG
ncbi:hypothetical protein ABIB90_002260 [Bradyrhizobium sp. JR4.1]|uniref:hypothetical protein n=2 Tax=unclassified Bradyrhizobium TaxID=2631580 RepID=UPI0012F4CD3A